MNFPGRRSRPSHEPSISAAGYPGYPDPVVEDYIPGPVRASDAASPMAAAPAASMPQPSTAPAPDLSSEEMTRAVQEAAREMVREEKLKEATGSLVLGLVTAVGGAITGVALFAYLVDSPITEDIPGTLTFAAFGMGLPFGWHMTRLRGGGLTLPLIVWPFALILRFYLSLLIGLPTMVFYALRSLWRFHRA